MAVTVALVGGPCDGQTRRISNATLASGHLTCQGATYTRLRQVLTNGLITFGSNLPPPPPPGSGGSTPGTHSLKAWGDLRRQINTALPMTLRTISRLNQGTLSGLASKRRVRR